MPRPTLAQEHSPTSIAAARSTPVHRNRTLVWNALLAATNGLTDEEGERRTGLGGSSYRPRRVDLMNDGLVVDSGQTRRTALGRRAVVWLARAPRSNP